MRYLTVTDIAVSQSFVGRDEVARRFVADLSGAPLLTPQPGQPPVAPPNAEWHLDQVFRGPARERAA